MGRGTSSIYQGSQGNLLCSQPTSRARLVLLAARKASPSRDEVLGSAAEMTGCWDPCSYSYTGRKHCDQAQALIEAVKKGEKSREAAAPVSGPLSLSCWEEEGVRAS